MSFKRCLGAVALAVCGLLGIASPLAAYELPPKPTTYVTDQAGVLDSGTVDTLNRQLDQVERDTSNQILVAVYRDLPDDAEVAQYSTEAYNAWGVGQKGKDNGAVLFVFINQHKMFIATGRGLEGALPDATCKNIITRVITPAFKQGNFSGGISAGVGAMIAASKGEYTGTGRTDANQNGDDQQLPGWAVVLIVILIILFVIARMIWFPNFGGPMVYTSGGWSSGSGGFGGGGGGGGGDSFGGFSGGGGNSAGGGAGGSW